MDMGLVMGIVIFMVMATMTTATNTLIIEIETIMTVATMIVITIGGVDPIISDG